MAEVMCNGGNCSNDTVKLAIGEYRHVKDIAMQLGKQVVEIKYVVDENENDEFRVEIHLR
tara:strand:+ start:5743 stop:5922 length:180 start_codon:yes stop_codon:yes gene_type:complete